MGSRVLALLVIVTLPGCVRFPASPSDAKPSDQGGADDIDAVPADSSVIRDAPPVDALPVDALPVDAPHVDGVVVYDAKLADTALPADTAPDAASRPCLDPKANYTSRGCVLPGLCSLSAPTSCPKGYRCERTPTANTCTCNEPDICGRRCATSKDCYASSPSCRSGVCRPQRGCSPWSAKTSCPSSKQCSTQHWLCEAGAGPGTKPLDVFCNVNADCASNLCIRRLGQRYCSRPCTKNSDCPSGSPRCEVATVRYCSTNTACTGCLANESCVDGGCRRYCTKGSDCAGTDCVALGYHAGVLACGLTSPAKCAANEIYVTTALVGGSPASRCVTYQDCDIDADCATPNPKCITIRTPQTGRELRLCGHP